MGGILLDSHGTGLFFRMARFADVKAKIRMTSSTNIQCCLKWCQQQTKNMVVSTKLANI